MTEFNIFIPINYLSSLQVNKFCSKVLSLMYILFVWASSSALLPLPTVALDLTIYFLSFDRCTRIYKENLPTTNSLQIVRNFVEYFIATIAYRHYYVSFRSLILKKISTALPVSIDIVPNATIFKPLPFPFLSPFFPNLFDKKNKLN